MADECSAIEIPRFKGKKGACIFLPQNTNLKVSWVQNIPKIAALRPYWHYSWRCIIPDGAKIPECIDYVPMVWGCGDEEVYSCDIAHCRENWQTNSSTKLLLGFNEPDVQNQSNIPPRRALEVWPDLEALGLPLASPACGEAEGRWMNNFMNQAQERGYRIDIIAVHDYANNGIPQLFKDKMIRMYEKYNKPILVTEFALADWDAKTPSECRFTPEEALEFMKDVLPWMEEQDWILGYCWFSFRVDDPVGGKCSALFDENFQLTTLGKYYAEFLPNPEFENNNDPPEPPCIPDYPTVDIPRPEGKKGVCFTLREKHQDGSWVENMPKVSALRPFWCYSWGPNIPNDCKVCFPNDCIDFFPMIWGYYPQWFPKTLEKIQALQPKMLLGFNEPDKKDQSNLTVDQVLEAWPQMETALAGSLPLVSPACANVFSDWMVQFMEQVKERNLRVDVIAVHDYGGGSSQAFKDKLTKVYEMYGHRPILVTEFGVADWNCKSVDKCKHKPEKVLQFMKDVLPWMEAQDWIIGYAWFPFSITDCHGTCSALFDTDGQLTPLGSFYAEFQANSKV